MLSTTTAMKKSKSDLLYKVVLKRILAYLVSEEQTCPLIIKNISKLAKSEIFIKLDKVLIKQRELLCVHCRQLFTNKLIFILHLQLIHSDQLCVTQYEFERERLIIHIEGKSSSTDNYLVETEPQYLFLVGEHLDRMADILNRIFSKFTNKKGRKWKTTFYHSNNIFAEIGTSSEEEDSQNEVGHIERDLERNRINEFEDVNEKDKLLFSVWNNLIHEAKKIQQILDHDDMVKILEQFAKECKRQGIKRMNFFTHAWTLWSAGKIQPNDVSHCLNVYDSY